MKKKVPKVESSKRKGSQGRRFTDDQKHRAVELIGTGPTMEAIARQVILTAVDAYRGSARRP